MTNENQLLAAVSEAREEDKKVLNDMAPCTANGYEQDASSEENEEDLPNLAHLQHDTRELEKENAKLEEVLTGVVPHRFRNMALRVMLGAVLIGSFISAIYAGFIGLVLVIMFFQFGTWKEIIDLGYLVYKTDNLPLFRSLSWYILFVSVYFVYGESLIELCGIVLKRDEFLRPVVQNHQLISYMLYMGGFVAFVLSLRKGYYFRQFSLFAWTHTATMIVGVGAYSFMKLTQEGLIWFILPVSLVVLNDIFAYFFGFFIGRTPLIAVSPKKTVEGFVGGIFGTVASAVVMCHALAEVNYLTCPVQYLGSASFTTECDTRPAVFYERSYSVFNFYTFETYPFVIHGVILALFCSIIGPFGGFFASGFKRACRVKDFGGIFPGHGGVTDRADCMIIMALFAFVYMQTFVKSYSIKQMELLISDMTMEDKYSLYRMLKENYYSN